MKETSCIRDRFHKNQRSLGHNQRARQVEPVEDMPTSTRYTRVNQRSEERNGEGKR